MTVWVQDPYSYPKPILSGTNIYVQENSGNVRFELTDISGLVSGSYTNPNMTVDTRGRILSISNGVGGSGVLTGTGVSGRVGIWNGIDDIRYDNNFSYAFITGTLTLQTGSLIIGATSTTALIELKTRRASAFIFDSVHGVRRITLESHESTSAGNELLMRTSRGPRETGSAVTEGTELGGVMMAGFAPSGFTSAKAGVKAYADENWTDSSNGTQFQWLTTLTGTTTLRGWMALGRDGRLSLVNDLISHTFPSKLYIGDNEDPPLVQIDYQQSDDNVYDILSLRRKRYDGVSPGAGIGVGISFALETQINNELVTAGAIRTTWNVGQSSTGTRHSSIYGLTMTSGTLTKAFEFDDVGNFEVAGNINITGSIINSTAIAARVVSTGTIIPSGTSTALSFQTERFDTMNLHSTSSNIGRLTAPVSGIYFIHGTVRWNAGTGGVRALTIRLNGTTELAGENDFPGNQVMAQTVSTVYYLAAGDYVELTGFQNDSGSIAITVSGNRSPEFAMFRVA